MYIFTDEAKERYSTIKLKFALHFKEVLDELDNLIKINEFWAFWIPECKDYQAVSVRMIMEIVKERYPAQFEEFVKETSNE